MPGLQKIVRRVLAKAGRVSIESIARPTLGGPPLTRLGSDYGGWWVPLDLLTSDSICYLAGVGEDVTFDLALAQAVGCDVWAMDPTPRSIAYAATINEPRFHFLPVGVWSANETLRFYSPADASHVSHSVVNTQKTETYFEADCRTIPDLMSDLGHAHLDLLKLDIEGAEVAVLDHLLAQQVLPTVLAVEFDSIELPWQTLQRLNRLRSAGYVLRHREGRNYILVRTTGHQAR